MAHLRMEKQGRVSVFLAVGTVFLPGESQGQGSLLGCCLWGRTESDMTAVTQQHSKTCLKKTEHRRIDAFELWCWRRLESPLDCKEIQPVHSKGNQSWVFIGRTDAEAETPILWSLDVKNQLIGKDPDAGKD